MNTRTHIPLDSDSSRYAIARLTRIRRLRRVAWLLDAAVGIPGTRIRLGVDSLVGLLPGGGDLAMAVVSLYIVHEARSLGVPARLLRQMLLNVGIDLLVGTVPVLGDLFDVGFKANLRNIDLIERHFGIAL